LIKKTITVLFLIIQITSISQASLQLKDLQAGDLLFLSEQCGSFCSAISNSTTPTSSDKQINHVAILLNSTSDKQAVIEAIRPEVTTTSLHSLIDNTYGKNNRTNILVGRLKSQYKDIIPQALLYAKEQMGKPYNATFNNNSYSSFYCSQLVTFSFNKAYSKQQHNKDSMLFKLSPMSFKNKHTGKIDKTWSAYFKNLKAPIPQGEYGSSPFLLSKNNKILNFFILIT
jgi:uncharacterized protein YycO